MGAQLPLFVPLVPAVLWLVLRVGMPARIRGGGWLGAGVTAAGCGVALALWTMATEVTGREQAKITAGVLYDAVGAAGTGLVGAALGFAVVVIAEVALRGRRPALGPSALGPWAAGLVGAGLVGLAARGTWSLMSAVGAAALVIDQRQAGIPARAVDTRSLAGNLFSSAGFTTVALGFGLLAMVLAVAPAREKAGNTAPGKPTRR